MNTGETIDLLREAMVLVIVLALPVLGIGLAVALFVSLMQAVTQVQEQTLSFVPKIIAMLLALVIFAPWMIARMVEFGREMFGAVP